MFIDAHMGPLTRMELYPDKHILNEAAITKKSIEGPQRTAYASSAAG